MGERSVEHQELGDETRQPGQPERCEKCQAHQRGVLGNDLGDPTKSLDLPVVGAVVDHPDDEEQHRTDDSVGK